MPTLSMLATMVSRAPCSRANCLPDWPTDRSCKAVDPAGVADPVWNTRLYALSLSLPSLHRPSLQCMRARTASLDFGHSGRSWLQLNLRGICQDGPFAHRTFQRAVEQNRGSPAHSNRRYRGTSAVDKPPPPPPCRPATVHVNYVLRFLLASLTLSTSSLSADIPPLRRSRQSQRVRIPVDVAHREHKWVMDGSKLRCPTHNLA
ncbi:hypothetical protein DENSPDRAFT_501846 [Dentipellis sp. KUC8613]|nr:hypothetical protein DENSPDRAFT_501846 [Dentipellis sp. KUC8613]